MCIRDSSYTHLRVSCRDNGSVLLRGLHLCSAQEGALPRGHRAKMCIRDRLMYKTIRKLEAITDAEFEELYIMPDGMVDD